MSGNCIDIGTIQAFLDGETTPQHSLRVADHIGGCEACSLALSQAEEETAAVFSALDREMNALVPTQRLWSRINNSIADEKGRLSVWQRVLTFVSVSVATPAMAAAASFVVILGIVALIWNPNQVPTGSEFARKPAASAPISNGTIGVPVNNSEPASATTALEPDREATLAGSSKAFKESKLSDGQLNRLVVNASATENRQVRPAAVSAVHSETLANGYLPGEESYVKTIADLSQGAESKVDTAMPASSRVKYERDMAVVDDSIKKMRKVVRTNPRNQAARQILYSAYQDKIDLLNSVAQREELMASLR